MISKDFQKCMELFEKCLEELSEKSGVDWNQSKWISEIENGKYKRSIEKSILNQKLCREKFERTHYYSDLKIEFSEIPLIFNSKIAQESLFDQFIETYFHLSQKVEFEEKYFVNLCDILQQHISKEYFNNFYFFTPIYNFDTEFPAEIEIDEFKITKISPTHFDRISSINLHDGKNEPNIEYPIEQLKYVLLFSIEYSGIAIDPKKISSIFLNALRLTKSSYINFGHFYGYHPLCWQGYDAPGYTENTKLSNTVYLLKLENINSLKENFQLLNKLYTDFSNNQNKIRYLIDSIRKFDYSYRDNLVEDNITDLMISLETLLNNQPYEIRDKTSLRAAMIIEDDDDNRIECKKFIQQCYDIRSEIVHGKTRDTKIKENGIPLEDEDIKQRLGNCVRRCIVKMFKLQIKFKTQDEILVQIDRFTLDRSRSLFD